MYENYKISTRNSPFTGAPYKVNDQSEVHVSVASKRNLFD